MEERGPQVEIERPYVSGELDRVESEEIQSLIAASKEPYPDPVAWLDEAIKQIESCGYNCEAGPLELNVAWEEIRRAVEEVERLRELCLSVYRWLLILDCYGSAHTENEIATQSKI